MVLGSRPKANRVDEVIMGANGADPNGDLLAGDSYVVFGVPSPGTVGVLTLAGLASTRRGRRTKAA